MEKHHSHSHQNLPHVADQGNINKPFILGIILNITFVCVEFTYGFLSHSLSLIADAWHNLGDVAGLAISLIALKMATRKPNSRYTYGFSKGTILASLANGVLLLLAIGSIGYESVQRFFHPELPQWNIMIIVASIGVLINTATALLFHNKEELNSKAAFLHMASDAAVSLAVVVGGAFLHFSGYTWIDPALSILICIVILNGTWKLFRNSLRLSLDGVPDNIDINAIKTKAMEIPEIADIHHLHVWALSTTKNAMTAHLLLRTEVQEGRASEIKNEFKHQLAHLNIQHATLELETQHTDDLEECADC